MAFVCLVVGQIGALVMLFANNFWAQILGIILTLSYGDGLFNIAAVFIGETMGKKYRSFANSFNFFVYTAGVLLFLYMSVYL